MKVGILTSAGDQHAHAVKWALEKKGHHADLIFFGDLPQLANISCRFTKPFSIAASARSGKLQIEAYDRLWARRPGDAILPDHIHPLDRPAARVSWEFLLKSALRALNANGVTCINPVDAAEIGNLKGTQLNYAMASGLNTPDTLITNSSTDAREFIRDAATRGKRTIAKGVHTLVWDLDDEGLASFDTVRVTEADVDDDSLRLCPCVFQEEVLKAFEARVTVMGGTIFAARLDSQSFNASKLDYRNILDSSLLGCTPINPPPKVASAILEFHRRSGLLFSTSDFIITPEGKWIFLETNPCGQFLWVEHAHPDTPLLDAFCELLVSASGNFSYKKARIAVRLADYMNRPDRDNALSEELLAHPSGGQTNLPDVYLS